MKKFEIVTSTCFGHKIIVEANTEKEAEEKVSYMGQNEMEEKQKTLGMLMGFQCFVQLRK